MTFDAAGTYEVELTVTDDLNATDTMMTTIDVQEPLTVKIEGPDTVRVGGEYDWTAKASNGSGNILGYAWGVNSTPNGNARGGV